MTRYVLTLLCCLACAPLAGAVASPAPRSTPCTPTVFAPAGSPRADRLTGGPGLVLSGGGLMGMPYGSVLPWMRARIAAPPGTRAGNLLILKASGARDYSDLFYAHSKLGSIREILVPPCATRGDVDRMAAYVRRADAVLFAGGDQANYVAWKGSGLIAAVRGVYARGGIVGGGSAGLAIQGAVVFDSVAADKVLRDDQDVASPDAVKNPYERAISFTTHFFSWPPLASSITDTHFAQRNRFGRLAAFMARALQDRLVRGDRIYGVAVDEGAALLVDARGVATLVKRAREADGYVPRGAYVLTGRRAAQLTPGRPLLYTVDVTHIAAPGSSYDLISHSGAGTRYSVTVRGTGSPMYSRNPY